MKPTVLAISISIMFLFPLPVRAVEVRAFVDRTQTTINDPLQLTVSINDGSGDVDVSPIRDFQVMSQGTSSSYRVANGHVSKKISYNYTLLPLRQGDLKIPPLTVTVGKDSYQTREIVVHVSNSQQKQGAARNVFVTADISEKNPYVGQPIRYTFKLYNAARIANANLKREPSSSGFIFKKIDENKSYRTVISGRDFKVTQVNYILTPTTAGSQSIEPAVLECDVFQQKQRHRTNPFDSFFDDSFFNDPFFGHADFKPMIFKTSPITVNVKPLPVDTEHEKFSGLVGRFKLQGKLENNNINVGDSTTLSIIIEGIGNIMDAPAPEIDLPKSFKVYQDAPEEKIQVDSEGYSGKKVFRFALVGIKKGNYAIAPVHLRYFDTASHQYRTMNTPSFSLTVHPSKADHTLEVFSAPEKKSRVHQNLKKKVTLTGSDILPLKDGPDCLKKRTSLSLFRFILYHWIPILLFLGVKFVLIFSNKHDDPAVLMTQKSQKALKEAHGTDSDEIFLSSLYRALVYAVFSKAGSKGESLTYAEAEKLLSENGVPDETAAQSAALLKKIESAKYSGMILEKHVKKDLLSETHQMVRRLCR